MSGWVALRAVLVLGFAAVAGVGGGCTVAGNPFDREVINTRERPLSSDVNLVGSYADQAVKYFLEQHYGRRTSTTDPTSQGAGTGFIGDALRPRAASSPAMTVELAAGLGFIDDAALIASSVGGVSGVDDLSRLRTLVLTATETLVVPAADPTNPRIDIIEVAARQDLADSTSRHILNPSTGVFAPSNVFKTLTHVLDGQTGTVAAGSDSVTPIGYKTGTPAGSPSAPATTTGYVKIAEVLVGAAVSSIDNDVIKDLRAPLWVHGMAEVIVRGRFVLSTDTITVDMVSAPPGVRVGFRSDGSDAFLYVFVDDASAYKWTTHGYVSWETSATGLITGSSYVIGQPLSGSPVAAGLQTTLGTAAISNALPLDVAVGQEFLGSTLTMRNVTAALDDTLYNKAAAEWNITAVMKIFRQ